MDIRKNISIIKKGYENRQGRKAGNTLAARIIMVTGEIFKSKGRQFVPSYTWGMKKPFTRYPRPLKSHSLLLKACWTDYEKFPNGS